MGLVVLGIIIFVISFLSTGLGKQVPNLPHVNGVAWITRITGILFVVVGILWASVVIVPAGYRGVLLRFGAVSGQLGEGINFIIPGVNSVVPMEVRTQKEASTATAASSDLQIVTTDLALNFRVDPDRVSHLFQTVGTEYKSRIIDPTVQESVKVVTTRYTAEELIRRRAQVKAEVEQEITGRLKAYDVIVDPEGLSITNFDFSPDFNQAIERKQVAQQEAEKQKYVLQQAELQKQTAIAQAQGVSEAAKLNAAALQVQGGSLVIAREWIDKWDGHLPSVSAGGGSNGGGGFIIDLGSLVQSGTSQRSGTPKRNGQ
jgi:regulator of protease activity HflC (stomatin/prohibitin superfamily)